MINVENSYPALSHLPSVQSNMLTGMSSYLRLNHHRQAFNENINLLQISNDHPLNKLILFDMNTFQTYKVRLNHVKDGSKHECTGSNSNQFDEESIYNSSCPSICKIGRRCLPSSLMDKSFASPIPDNFNMILLIGGKEQADSASKAKASANCYLCALPALSESGNMSSWNTALPSDAHTVSGIANTTQYINGFGYHFPSLPTSLYGVSSVYDAYHDRVFVMNPYNVHSREIWSCELNAESIDKMHWTQTGNSLLMSRSATSVCMVDKGRYIAIMGGKARYEHNGVHTKGMELFAINANRSITLQLMNRFSEHAQSVYNEHLHNIVLGDTVGFELYDINQDTWMNLYDRFYNTLSVGHSKKCSIWISPSNPFIVYFSGYKRIKSQWFEQSDATNYMIERFDIRDYTRKPVVHLRDTTYDDLAHYNEVFSFHEKQINVQNTQVIVS